MLEKKSVIFIDLGSQYGGVETYIEGLAEMLDPYTKLYALCSPPKLADGLRSRGVTVIKLPFESKWTKPLRLVLALLLLPYIRFRLHIRIVQLNGYFESLLLIPLYILGCRTFYTMHGPFETELYSWLRNPARLFPRWLSKRCLRFASHIICVSETVGAIARNELPLEKISVIANWVKLPAAFKQNFSDVKSGYLLFVGRVEEYKGIQLILEALKQIPHIPLVIVGDGTYRSQLEEMSADMDIRFLGFQSNPSRFYEGAIAFINPSLGPEGLPLVSLEAMAYGLPCIFSDLPVHIEITNMGQAAGLFRSGSSESLAQAIKEVLGDESLRRRYGLAARDMTKTKYSYEVALSKYLKLFGCDDISMT